MKKILLIVNPIAGIGGPLGLKGSDGIPLRELGISRGPGLSRAYGYLRLVPSKHLSRACFLVPHGLMGSLLLDKIGASYDIICEPSYPSRVSDTLECIEKGLKQDPDLAVIAGGDGTLYEASKKIDGAIPVLGVPCGTKMYSSIFPRSLSDAAFLTASFIEGKYRKVIGEVVLVDEDALRKDRGFRVKDRLLVETINSNVRELLQGSKDFASRGWDPENLEEIIEYLIDEVIADTEVLILGPGSTLVALAERLGFSKPVLGVAVVVNGKLICADCGAEQVYRAVSNALSEGRKTKLVLSPLGGTGFLLGRGNQQITRSTLRLLGKSNIIVIAARDKVRGLRHLYVDTGDPLLDKDLSGYTRVITGYREEKVMHVRPGSSPTTPTVFEEIS